MARATVLAFVATLLAGCSGGPRGGELGAPIVIVPADADATTTRTADALAGYLERIAGAAAVVEVDALDDEAVAALVGEHGAEVAIVLEGERDRAHFEPTRVDALGPWGFALEHDEHGDRTVVWTAASTRLARQYAAFEVLRRLGVRFYHPEAEHVPLLDPAQLRARIVEPTALQPRGDDARPDFAWRSWSFHSQHPLEHLEAFSDGDHPIDDARHVEEWIVKNRGNRFRGPGRGIASEEAQARRAAELEQLRVELGFPRGTGITLHNQQQGASAEIDPNGATPVQQQIETLVAAKLDEVPDAEWFGIHFGPTEFTVTPDQQTVQWIEWAAAAARARKPGIAIEINDHITGSQPSPSYDDLGCPNGTNDEGRIDYYDLAFHTDASYGVQVHTVMHYPLEGEARVYAQRSFAHKLCLMQQASARGRPLTYFPEGAWWLSFDNPVPVYLPVYIWARHRDVELLRPLLPRNGGTLAGLRMFDSGHEWGYWQQDYAVGLLAWNAELGLDDVLGELVDPLCTPDEPAPCSAKLEALAILREVIDHQRELFLERVDASGRPGGLYTYFAGEDQADRIAAASGLEFRPVCPSFTDVMDYDADARAAFAELDLAALDDAATRYAAWVRRMAELTIATPAAAQPWIAEMLDGLAIVGVRARHTAALYRAALAYRDAQTSGGDPAQAASAAWADAEVALAEATGIVRRREAAYRYPAAQVYGGGLTLETAVENGTTYPYRVHTKTHLLTYWHNRHDEVATILAGGAVGDAGRVAIHDAIAPIGTPLTVEWPLLEPLGGMVSLGALGELVPPATMLDAGTHAGAFVVEGLLMAADRELPVAGNVVRTDAIARTPRMGLVLEEPADRLAQSVLASVFPAVEWGLTASQLAIAHDGDDDGVVDHDATAVTDVMLDGETFVGEPITLDIPVALGSGGNPVVVTLVDAVFSGALADEIHATGGIEVADLVRALMELAGYDEQGALETLASLLGFDPAQPPETVAFAATFMLEP